MHYRVHVRVFDVREVVFEIYLLGERTETRWSLQRWEKRVLSSRYRLEAAVDANWDSAPWRWWARSSCRCSCTDGCGDQRHENGKDAVPSLIYSSRSSFPSSCCSFANRFARKLARCVFSWSCHDRLTSHLPHTHSFYSLTLGSTCVAKNQSESRFPNQSVFCLLN